MSVEERALRARNLRTLALLAGLFLLPLLVAFCTYYGSSWRPARRLNHGELLRPARPLPEARLDAAPGWPAPPAPLWHGQWSLVYAGMGACPQECREALTLMRQTRLALNQDMGRVRRVFMVRAGCCPAAELMREHPGLIVVDATGPAGAPLLQQFPDEPAARVFLVDPLGNLILSYDARQDPHGLL
ncbi:MAG: hypothetical protein JO005_04800, partial [Gammaproteobacteria bacterium]|nr:hypothetical protein [Gammaproteobacteria bacterium]